MWAYLAAYEMPNDDPERAARARPGSTTRSRRPRARARASRRRVRLQRRFSTPGEINRFERVLVWCHWVWFVVPHASVALRAAARRPSGSASAAARMYAVFDLGAVVLLGDPDRAAVVRGPHGRLGRRRAAAVRRMMIEYGEQFWGDRWTALYDVLGGNPLAAMPSLHFATSLMAAHLLSEVGPVAGAVGWTYAGLLGLALVYLGRALRGRSARRRARWPRRCARGRARRRSPAARGPGRAAALATAARERGARCATASIEQRDGGRTSADADDARRSARRPERRGPAARPHAEEMPRVRLTRGRLLGLDHVRRLDRSRSCTSCCRSCSACSDTWNRIEHGNVVVAGARRACSRCCSFVGYIALFRAVFVRGAVADRLARELPDHDGRAGRDPAVRVGRRRRDRADRVGAAPLGHGARGWSPAG